MKEEEKFRRDLNNAIDLYGNYKLMPYNKNNGKFSIIKVDPCILHPLITDKELLSKEIYRLSTESELSRGQYRFEIQCKSKEELLEVFLYLTRRGYKYTKILWQSARELKRVWYTIEELEKREKGYAPGIHNILEVIVNLKDLEKFKKDIYDLRKVLDYRCQWGSGIDNFLGFIDIID